MIPYRFYEAQAILALRNLKDDPGNRYWTLHLTRQVRVLASGYFGWAQWSSVELRTEEHQVLDRLVEAMRGSLTEGREAHILETAGSIPAPATG